MVKLENKLKLKKIKIGILGGTFDPAHKGHLEISKQAKKKFKLKNIIWAITKKNPFKNKSQSSLKSRMQLAKKLTQKNDFIKVKFFEKKIDSNRTINLILRLRGYMNITTHFYHHLHSDLQSVLLFQRRYLNEKFYGSRC